MKEIKRIILSLMAITVLTSCESQLQASHRLLRDLGIPPIEVNVSHVLDGDTFVYEVANHPSGTVDLGCNVTAFKLKQELGIHSKVMLESLLPPGSKVTIYPLEYSSSGNISALVINHSNLVVNQEIVRSGWAVLNPNIKPHPYCTKKITENDPVIFFLNSAFFTGLNSGPFKDKDKSSITLP